MEIIVFNIYQLSKKRKQGGKPQTKVIIIKIKSKHLFHIQKLTYLGVSESPKVLETVVNTLFNSKSGNNRGKILEIFARSRLLVIKNKTNFIDYL